MSVTKDRNSNIELLRIVATVGVIILHYNNIESGKAFLYTENIGINYQLLLMLELLSICAVNIFIIISGFFLCESNKLSVKKPIILLAEVVIFQYVRYILEIWGGIINARSLAECLVPFNWYVWVYIALYVISPFINIIISAINKRQFQIFLGIWIVLFSFWPTVIDLFSSLFKVNLTALYTTGTFGSGDGYTIINFILMYLFGAYIKKYGREIAWWKALGAYSIISLILYLYARVSFSGALAYSNPLVIFQAVTLFKAFEEIKFQSKFINKVAEGCFTVYLLHTCFFPYMQIQRFTTSSPVIALLHCILSCMIIFSICWGIYFIYKNTIKKMMEYILNLNKKKWTIEL